MSVSIGLLNFIRQLSSQVVRTLGSATHRVKSSRRRHWLDHTEALESRALLTTFLVTTNQDVVNPSDGVTSLREAIASANSAPGADTIQFSSAANGTISLNLGVFNITDSLTIQGNGNQQTVLDGHNASRILNFSNNTGNLTLNNLTVRNGYSLGNAGGINFDSTGTLSIDRCTVTQNTANYGGGGIYSFLGAVTISNSTISQNRAGNYYPRGGGGGIAMNFGVVTLINSTISGNSVNGHGGGVSVATGSLNLKNTTVAQNTATQTERFGEYIGGYGGGLYVKNAAITLTNSTVARNQANSEGQGAGVYIAGTAAMLTARNSIVARNLVVSGVESDVSHANPTTLEFASSLLGSNASTSLTPSSSPDANWNLIGTRAAPIDPLLNPLSDNAGPTQTMEPSFDSPALDRGSNLLATNAGLTTDQRGQPRIYNGTVDMGAVEVQPFTIVVDTILDVTNPNDGVTSLREALEISNTKSGTQRIAFAEQANGTIVLQQGTLEVKDSVTIDGNGSTQTIISGNDLFGVLNANQPSSQFSDFTLKINNLTITHGKSTLGGGIIFSQPGVLMGDGVTISDNTARTGGGIYHAREGYIRLVNSTVARNTATTENDGQVVGNSDGEGGGLWTQRASIFLYNSTIAGNQAKLVGAGLSTFSGDLELVNTTVAANWARGIFGGGIANAFGTLTAKNSIIARNIAPQYADIVAGNGVTFTLTHSFLGVNDGTSLLPAFLPDANGNYIGTGTLPLDPLLKPLAFNGGSTQTMGLASNSPAIDRGDSQVASVAGLSFDQRGRPRTSGVRPDMGAVEYQFNTVAFGSDTFSVDEDAGTASIDVRLAAPADQDLIIPFSVGGTASHPDDYTIQDNPLTIPAGATSGLIHISIVDLMRFELAETVILTLQPVAGAVLGTTTTTTLTIVDLDPAPSVDFTIAESSVNEDAGTYLVTVKLFEVSGVDVTVPFTVSGTAGSPSDFSIAASSVVIPAGQLTATIPVTIVNSPTIEATETVILTMGTIVNGVPGQLTSTTLTILNVLPTVTFSAANSAVNENAGTVNVTVTLSAVSAVPVNVLLNVQGTASSLNDYTIPSLSITIPAGQTSAVIPVTILNDSNTEPAETIILQLSPQTTNATLGQVTTHTLSINPSDQVPSLSFRDTQIVEINENIQTPAQLVLVLSVVADVAITVPFSLSGTATNGVDFTLNASPLLIPAGSTEVAFVVTPKLDGRIEGSETLTVTLGTPSLGTLGSNTAATIRFLDVDVNHAPTIPAGQIFNLPENSGNGTLVGTVLAQDADLPAPYNTLTFVVPSPLPGAPFSINSQGQITVINKAALDFETSQSFTLSVTVTDGGTPGLSTTQDFTIQLSDVNEAPTLSSAPSSASVPENTTAVLTVTGSDPDVGQTLAYSISGGADASKFAINPATGVVRFILAPNYESPIDAGSNNIYNITVRATDNGTGNLFGTQDLTITVTNVNEAPVITSASTVSTSENSTAVMTVTASDPDAGQTLTYSISGGSDASQFTIHPVTGQLSFRTAPNFESPSDANGDNVYQVSVQVSDNGSSNLLATRDLTVTVTNVNEAPTAGGPVTSNVPENSTAVLTVTGSDPDAGQSVGYSIAGGADASQFTIDSVTGVLTFKTAPNFEVPTDTGRNNVYQVTVQVADNGLGNLFATRDLEVTVTDVNEAPTITSASSIDVSENSTVVLSLTVTDPDGQQALAYSIEGGADAAQFMIDSATGILTFKIAPNFEAPADASHNNVYRVTIRATDNGVGSLFAKRDLVITVKNVNEFPSINLANNFNVAENSTAVVTVTATDPDVGQQLTYSIRGGTDAGQFTIDPTTGVLSFTNAPNSENPLDVNGDNVYQVTVQATDNGLGNLFATRDLLITVTDVNEAPTITSASLLSIPENSSIVLTVTATDPDVQKDLAYSISGGADSSKFAIDPVSGVVQFILAPNYESPIDAGLNNIYNITVRATDNGTGNLFGSQDLTITVTNVNEAPVITSASTISTSENSTAVMTVAASDPDAGQTLTYSISGGSDASQFTIHPVTGELSFRTAPNFESPSDTNGDNVYQVTVQVRDNGISNLLATRDLTVTVTNVNEAPTAGGPVTSNVPENSTAVLTVTGSDPDGGQSVGYSIAGGADASQFTIDSVTGILTFKTAPNFEAPTDTDRNNVYQVTVQVADNGLGNLFATRDLEVTVTNVNEPPVLLASTFTIDENSAADTNIGLLQASDPENGTLVYAIVSANPANPFMLNSSTGQLKVANPQPVLDFETTPTYVLQVQVSDVGGRTTTRAITVNLGNVAEPPQIAVGTTTATFTKAGAAASVFPNLTVLSPDGPKLLGTVVVSYTVLRRGDPEDVHFASSAALGTLAISGPSSFKTAAGTRTLTLTLNSEATVSEVQNFLRSITFSSKRLDTARVNLGRKIDVQVFDRNGNPSNKQVIQLRAVKK